jgi:hypothetical protein
MTEIISEILDTCMPLSSIDVVVRLSSFPHILKRDGRRYSRAFFYQNVRLLISQVGKQFCLDFAPGWNSFDFPDGTQIALASSETATIIHHLSDSEIIPM